MFAVVACDGEEALPVLLLLLLLLLLYVSSYCRVEYAAAEGARMHARPVLRSPGRQREVSADMA